MSERKPWGEPVPVPERYSQIEPLRKRGLLGRAVGPCAVCTREPPRYESGSPRYIYDHCHAHDWVRGVLCLNCNSSWMPKVDARLENRWRADLWPALVAHWHRCPQCAAEGWRPLYRVDRAADAAYVSAVRDAQRGPNPPAPSALREIGERAARLASPSVVRVGVWWCVPIAEA